MDYHLEQVDEYHDSPMRDAKWVAELTGLRVKQVYTLACEGVIPAERYGRLLRFNETEVRAWKASCRVAPKPTLEVLPPSTSVPADDDDFKVLAVRLCG